MAFVRSCGKRPTTAQRLLIGSRQERLQGQIDGWNKRANDYLVIENPNDDLDLPDLLHDNSGFMNDDSDDDTENDSADDRAESSSEALSRPSRHSHSLSAEHQILYFPSAFVPHLFEQQRKSELLLREGQANDALHHLRIALGKKSFLFRTHVRAARSQQRKTRAWSEVSEVDEEVQQQARIYRHCRRMMVKLAAPPEVLDRYQLLIPSHLKVSTAIAEPNARGQRNMQLAWFWSMDVQADTDTDSWMEECKTDSESVVALHCSPIISLQGALAEGKSSL